MSNRDQNGNCYYVYLYFTSAGVNELSNDKTAVDFVSIEYTVRLTSFINVWSASLDILYQSHHVEHFMAQNTEYFGK